MATLQQIADFARAVLQTDDTDLTDQMVTVFANDAVERILGVRNIWPHLYAEGTLSVVAGTSSYTLASASFSPQTFTTLESVWDDQGLGTSLVEVDYQGAAAYWLGSNQISSDRPSWFATSGGKIYLYPTPSGTRVFRVGGYRDPVEMDAMADTPDIPNRFHNAVKYGTVALSIAQTEDYEGAQWWTGMANESVRTALRAHFTNSVQRPIQLHGRGGPRMWTYSDWVRNMRP
jgi:hypothetical protein